MDSNLKKVPKNIGIVTAPGLTTGAIPLSNLIEILHSFSSFIYVISGDKEIGLLKKNSCNIHLLNVPHGRSTKALGRIKEHIRMQLRVSNKLVKLADNVDIWIFLFAEGLVLPMLTAKLLRKKTVLAFTGSGTHLKALEVTKDIITPASALLQSINYILADTIVLRSENIIAEHSMQRYRNKIVIGHEHFLDFTAFKIQKPLGERNNLVGYIGRLQEIKGVLKFVKSIQTILQERNDVSFLIGGEGPLREKLETYLHQVGLGNKVTFNSWIPHDELPNYLNKLKLLVIPSYTETGPYIAFEAMACGTPVLATPVGSIPDVIKNGKTGFIMENNSPECIARNVMRALNHPDLDEVVKNARELVVEEFTYEVAVEGYRRVVYNI